MIVFTSSLGARYMSPIIILLLSTSVTSRNSDSHNTELLREFNCLTWYSDFRILLSQYVKNRQTVDSTCHNRLCYTVNSVNDPPAKTPDYTKYLYFDFADKLSLLELVAYIMKLGTDTLVCQITDI